jgi:GTP cyclohydrolase I
MNRPEQPQNLMPIPDVQSARPDARRSPIDQVGIRGPPLPDRVRRPRRRRAAHDRDFANVYVALPEERKGTHMSRFVMLLEEHSAPGPRRCRSSALRR